MLHATSSGCCILPEFERREFPITVSGEMKTEAKAGALRNEISICTVDKPNPDYKLGKDAGNAARKQVVANGMSMEAAMRTITDETVGV